MRAPTTLKIKFKSASIEDFIERYSVDVSRGGIFIRSRSKRELDTGTSLKFEFMLQDGGIIMGGDGTVAWIREDDPTRPSATPGIGVRFDRIAGGSQLVLDRILSEKERRGEREVDSRYETGLREIRSTARAVEPVAEERDSRTPLPSPMPGLPSPAFEAANAAAPSVADLGAHATDFDNDESTRVMQPAQAEALLAKSREDGLPPPPPPPMRPVVTAPATARTLFEIPAAVLRSAVEAMAAAPVSSSAVAGITDGEAVPTAPGEAPTYLDPFAELAEELAREAAAAAAVTAAAARPTPVAPIEEPSNEVTRVEAAPPWATRFSTSLVDPSLVEAAFAEATIVGASPFETAPAAASPVEAAPHQAVAAGTAASEAAPVEAASVGASPVLDSGIESAAVAAAPVVPASVVAAPIEAAPIEATPIEAAPIEAAPIEAAPVVAAPIEAAQVVAALIEAAPIEAAQVEAAQVEAAQTEAAPVEAAHVEAAAVEARPVDAAPIVAASIEAPTIEAPAGDASPVEAPAVEALPVETSAADLPADETSPATPPAVEPVPSETGPAEGRLGAAVEPARGGDETPDLDAVAVAMAMSVGSAAAAPALAALGGAAIGVSATEAVSEPTPAPPAHRNDARYEATIMGTGDLAEAAQAAVATTLAMADSAVASAASKAGPAATPAVVSAASAAATPIAVPADASTMIKDAPGLAAAMAGSDATALLSAAPAAASSDATALLSPAAGASLGATAVMTGPAAKAPAASSAPAASPSARGATSGREPAPARPTASDKKASAEKTIVSSRTVSKAAATDAGFPWLVAILLLAFLTAGAWFLAPLLVPPGPASAPGESASPSRR